MFQVLIYINRKLIYLVKNHQRKIKEPQSSSKKIVDDAVVNHKLD